MLAVLDRAGLGRLVDSQGFPRISYLAFEFPEQVWIKGNIPTYAGRSWGYAVRREVLDDLLLQEVKCLPNVVVWEGCSLLQVTEEAGTATGIQCRLADGQELRVTADVVIGADGKWSTVAKQVNAPHYNVRSGRTCIYYAYFQGVAKEANQPSFVAYHGFSPYRFHLFAADADGELTGIGVETSVEHFSEFRSAPEQQLQRCIENVPALAARMKNSKRVTPVYGMRFPSSYLRRPYGPGWALVGDAGMLQDPITGQGVSNAADSALWLADAIKHWRGGVPWVCALRQYQRTRDQRTRTNYDRTYSLTDFSSDLPPWMQQWYRYVGSHDTEVALYLGVICNAIPPETFYSRRRLARAWLRHKLPGAFST